MTAIAATHIPGGSFAPDSFQVDVTSSPVKPTSAYASNFTSGVDSWSAFGTGATVTNDTAMNPDALLLSGAASSTDEVHAARAVAGLTVGAVYRMSAWLHTSPGQAHLAVRGATEGTEIAQSSWVSVPGHTLVTLDFTATIANQVIEVFTRQQHPFGGTSAKVWVDTVSVDPVSWLGTNIVRTDANGADVPVRNPNALDVNGVGALTLRDYEAAMVGPVTYTVTDGLGATATCTVSAAPTHTNRAINPVAAGMPAVTPWIANNAALSITGGSTILRGTLTTNTNADLAQNLVSASGGTAAHTLGEYTPGSAFQASVKARCSLATVAGTTITMQQVTSVTTSGTAVTLSMTVAPVAGDVMIVWASSAGAVGTNITSVTGLGATWAQIPTRSTIFSGYNQEWWIGTGANATGNVTVNRTTSANAQHRCFHIRGLTSTTATLTTTTQASSAASLTGNSTSAQAGQIVLTSAYVNSSTSLGTWTKTPTADWTDQAVRNDALTSSRNTSYRIPTETTPTTHNATLTPSSSTTMAIEHLVLGVPVTPSTPTPVLKARLFWYDAGGGSLGAVDSPNVTVNDTVFSDLVVTTTVPASAVYARLLVGLSGTVVRSVGDWIEVQQALLGRPGTWFAGNSAATDTAEYSWATTAHASPSLEISTAPVTDTPPSLTLPATALQTNNTSPPQFAELTMVTEFSETTESPVAVHTVIGRSDKLSNPAPMLARNGSFVLWCQDYEAARAARDLLKAPATAMLRQASFPGLDLYFVARSVRVDPTEKVLNQHWFVAVSYDEVPRPQ